MKERAGIQSVEVGFALLDVLGQSAGPLMLRDLAAAAGMSAAKAHRYLVSFQRLALVVQDAGTTRYDLGPAALKLGLASLSRLDAVKLARERVGALMEDHWPHHCAGGVGQPRPDRGALGRVPPGRHRQPAPGRCDAAAVIGHGALLCRLCVARRHCPHAARRAGPRAESWPHRCAGHHGRSEDHAGRGARARRGARGGHLLPGIVGFCAPVFDSDGHIVLGIVTLGSVATFDAAWDGAVHRPLAAAAAQLSADLGHGW
jgi:hypothetical protein